MSRVNGPLQFTQFVVVFVSIRDSTAVLRGGDKSHGMKRDYCISTYNTKQFSYGFAFIGGEK